MEPLGLIVGGAIGAALCSAIQTRGGRRLDGELAARVSVVETRISNSTAAWHQKLAALQEEQQAQRRTLEHWTKAMREQEQEREQAQAEALGRLNRIETVQDGTLNTFAAQLEEMQAFIVQAAEAARTRQVPPVAVPSAAGPAAMDAEEFQSLLLRQQQAQAEFAARMRDQSAQSFRQPAGGGL